jgi:hypothetical protein
VDSIERDLIQTKMEVLKAENKEYFAFKAREIAELCRNFNVPLSAPSTAVSKRKSSIAGRKLKFQGKTLKIEMPH